MTKRHIRWLFFQWLIIVFALTLGGSISSWAAKKTTPDGSQESACLLWCQQHNRTQPKMDSCANECIRINCDAKGQNCKLQAPPPAASGGGNTGPTHAAPSGASPPPKAQ